MAYCGIEGTMYGKVEACNFLCHPYAQKLITLTVEVSCSPACHQCKLPLGLVWLDIQSVRISSEPGSGKAVYCS